MTHKLFEAPLVSSSNTSEQTKSHVVDITLKTINSVPTLVVVREFIKTKTTAITRKDDFCCISSTKPLTQESVLNRWYEEFSYPMREVNTQELLELRLSDIPGAVYKKDDRYFYSEVPGTLSLNGKVSHLGHHSCSDNCTMVCNGCHRTRDLTVSYQMRFRKTFEVAVDRSWRVEKYPFVREGLETFNMNASNDAFIVFECDNYKVRPNKRKASKKSTTDLKVGLASFA